MIFLISLVLAVLAIALGRGFIKKHPVVCYCIAGIIAAALAVCTAVQAQAHFPMWLRTWVWPVFAKCSFASALFVIVMYTGVFSNGSKMIKILMPVRGEISIIASVLTLGHNISYGQTYFKMLFVRPMSMQKNVLAAAAVSIVMICIMLPLFITSFPSVRKKMKARNWKRLQRLAYVFYGLMYVHVMLLTVPGAVQGREGYMFNAAIYTLVFVGYALCRIQKALMKNRKGNSKLTGKRQLAAMLAALVITLGATAVLAGCGNSAADSSDALNSQTQILDSFNQPGDGVPESEKDGVDSNKDEKTENTVTDDTVDTEKSDNTEENGGEDEQEIGAQPDAGAAEYVTAANTGEQENNNSQPQTPEETQQTEKAAEQEPEPEPELEPEPESVSKYRDGTYSGSGQGYMGTVSVSVTIS